VKHLSGLKELLYANRLSRPTEQRDEALEVDLNAAVALGARPILESRVIEQTVETYRGEQLAHLLAMTPYYWKAPAAVQQDIMSGACGDLCTTVEFELSTYRLVPLSEEQQEEGGGQQEGKEEEEEDDDDDDDDEGQFLHISPCGDWWCGSSLYAAKHNPSDYVRSLPLPTGFIVSSAVSTECMHRMYDCSTVDRACLVPAAGNTTGEE
jgi:hypothetical protein